MHCSAYMNIASSTVNKRISEKSSNWHYCTEHLLKIKTKLGP